MKRNRRTLFSISLAATLIMMMSVTVAQASTTKVGNGDDGSDLEALTPIKDGPIWESRQQAIELLQRLNVPGIAGLGLVIPELKNTEMLLAKQDVHATIEQAGSFETSEDKASVYARTFAEPYAATRFFPAATHLSSEQLVALHIHEALHRALPAAIRADENRVMILTLAMTSPGATFDRVSSVAGLYVQPALPQMVVANASAVETSVASQKDVVLPEKSRTNLAYSLAVMEGSTDFGGPLFQTLEIGTSLGGYRKFGTLAIEPFFRGRLLSPLAKGVSSLLGPVGLEFQGRLKSEDGAFYGPLLRFNSKSIDDASYGADRDVVSVGGFYRAEEGRTYLDVSALYSFPSSSSSQGGSYMTYKTEEKYDSIFSLMSRFGLRLGKFYLGGIADLHAAQGAETKTTVTYIDSQYEPREMEPSQRTVSPFRALVVGPEIGFVTNRFQFKLSYQKLLNSTQADLNALGDVLDRGSGIGSISTSLSMSL